MEDIGQGVDGADSPTADTADTSATTLNTGTQQPSEAKLPRFDQHPDWQRMVRERNDARARDEATQRELGELRQWRQTQEQQRGMTPEQEQLLKAGDALEKIFEQHPRLKSMWEGSKNGQQTQQTLQTLQKAQGEAHQRSARTEITNIAKEAGYTSPRAVKHLEAVLAQEVLEMGPEALQKYRAGDFSVFRAAFEQAKSDGLIAATRQTATAQTLTTKNATKNLPPRPAGGPAGREAPAQHEPGSKQWLAQLRQKASAVIGGSA